MLLIHLALLANFIIDIGFGIFVFFSSQQKQVGLTFLFFMLSIAFWALGISQFILAPDLSLATLWCKEYYIAAALIPYFFLLFVRVFPEGKRSLRTIEIIGWSFAPILICFISAYETLIIKEIIFSPPNHLVIFNPVTYFLYMLYFCSYICISFYLLATKYSKADSITRLQIKYMLWGLLPAFSIGMLFNLFIPVYSYSLIWIGPSFTFIIAGMFSYAIARHRLMDIQIILSKSLIYLMLTFIISVIFASGIIFSGSILWQRFGIHPYVISLIISVLIVISYDYVRNILEMLTQTIFFRRKYDYQQVLRQMTRSLNNIINLELLINDVMNQISNAIRVSTSSLYLANEQTGYDMRFASHFKEGMAKLAVDSSLVRLLLEKQETVVAGELQRLQMPEEIQAKEEMKRLGAAISIPLFHKEQLAGIINLGEKLSQDIFTAEDISLLETLANQIVVSIENARLYDSAYELKSYYQNILENINIGIITFNQIGEIISMNQKGEDLTGLNFADIQHEPSTILEQVDPIFNRVITTLQLQKPTKHSEFNLAVPGKIGTIPVGFRTELLTDTYNKPTGVICILTELAEIRGLQQQLERNERLASLGTMAAGIAHEIRNPMVSIKAFSQLLTTKYNDPEFREKFSKIVLPQLTRIEDLITALLHIGKPKKPELSMIDINSVLKDVVMLIENDRKQFNAIVDQQYIDQLAVWADRAQITQVILNLCRNGMQAMDGEGGRLEIGSAVINADWAEICVTDSGKGISPEVLKHLFDPFFSTKEEGTGLGLSISYQIVAEHHGQITVDSVEGKGTTFRVILPRHANVLEYLGK